MRRISEIVVAWVLVAASAGCVQPKVHRLEIHPVGSERQILESLQSRKPERPVYSYLNILDHAYAALMARAYPKPEEAALVAKAVAAICEEFHRETGMEMAAARRQSLTVVAVRTGSFEGLLGSLQTQSPRDLDRERLIEAGLTGMLSGPRPPGWLVAKDEGAVFKGLIRARIEPATERGLIGLDLTNWPTVKVLPNGPAGEAGVKDGDVILEVNGSDVSSVRSTEDAVSLLAGPVAGKVAVKVLRGSQQLKFVLRRVSLGAISVRAEMVKPGIIHVFIPTLEGTGIARRVERMLAGFDVASHRIVLDVRDNSGGRIEECNAIGSLFLDGKILEILEFEDGRRIAFRAKAGAIRPNVLVLVNHNTGSAAEVLAMALRDNAAALIVGERTAGMLCGKDLETLEDGRVMVIRTEPILLSPIDKDYSSEGIPADIELPDKRDGRDEILERAIKAIDEQTHLPAHCPSHFARVAEMVCSFSGANSQTAH